MTAKVVHVWTIESLFTSTYHSQLLGRKEENKIRMKHYFLSLNPKRERGGSSGYCIAKFSTVKLSR